MTTLKTISKPWRTYLFGWVPLWAYSLLMIHEASVTSSRLSRIFLRWNDKLVHALEFFLLYWITMNAFQKAKSPLLRRGAAVYAFLYAFFMGIVTECVQFFAPNRFPEFWDFMADLGGSTLALLMMLAFKWRGGF